MDFVTTTSPRLLLARAGEPAVTDSDTLAVSVLRREALPVDPVIWRESVNSTRSLIVTSTIVPGLLTGLLRLADDGRTAVTAGLATRKSLLQSGWNGPCAHGVGGAAALGFLTDPDFPALYPAALRTAGTVEEEARRRGVQVVHLAVYQSVIRTDWTNAEREAARTCACAAALSPRAAEGLVALLAAAGRSPTQVLLKGTPSACARLARLGWHAEPLSSFC